MKHDFTEWLAAIGSPRFEARRRFFFAQVFTLLASQGFVLENPDAIAGGYRLEFKKGDCWVIADRYSSYPVSGETPGIQLYNETESWEASFSAYTPFHLVASALETLTTEQE